MQQAYVYTDGSCDNRTGVDGGYGVVIVYGDKVFKNIWRKVLQYYQSENGVNGSNSCT